MLVEEVVSVAITLRTLVRRVDVEELSGDECVLVVEEFARVEKACAAVRAMAAARAAACGTHRQTGSASAEDWLAGLTGSTRGQAKSDLDTGARLGDCPKTKEAAVDGELSLGQAGEIARTEVEKPGSEDALVDKAKSSTRQELNDACRKRRQEGVDRAELSRKQHARRSLRTWTDGDGMICGQFRLEPVVGVPLLARLEAESDRIRREARRNGSVEPWEAHAADALVAMLGTEGAKAAKAKAEVVFVVDLRTYRSGTHDDTMSHIVGGGPVDPDVVAEMAKDAFLKVVFHDGVNIHTVAHLGRYIPAELRTALELGRLPDLDGVECVDCGKRFRLEWDHVVPVCAGGVTSYKNQRPRCTQCHRVKSDDERAAGLYKKGPPAPPAPPPNPAGDDGPKACDVNDAWGHNLAESATSVASSGFGGDNGHQ